MSASQLKNMSQAELLDMISKLQKENSKLENENKTLSNKIKKTRRQNHSL